MGFKTKNQLITDMPLGFQIRDFIDTVYPGSISIGAFGAKGDGVTDDTLAIARASDEAIATNKSVFFPPGTYIVDTTRDSSMSGYSGIVTSAAYFVTGTSKKLIWRGAGVTIKTKLGDGGGYIVFAEDIDVFDTDGFSFESTATIEGKNGPIYCAGVREVHLGTQYYKGFGNNLICGSSFTRVPSLLTFEYQEFEDMYNTLCFTTKPGGCKQIYGGTIVMRDCRGGVSIEAEDNQGHGLPDHTVEYCQINKVIGYDLDATKGSQSGNICYVLKFEDNVQYAQIGQIIGENITNATSTVDGHLSGPLLISEGQEDSVPLHVHVGSVIADNCERAVTLSTKTSTSQSVVIESVQCGQVGYILVVKPFDAPTAATGAFRRVKIGTAFAETIERPSDVSGVGILVQGSNPEDGAIVENLVIDTLSYNNTENNGVAIRNVQSFHLGQHVGVTHDSFASGGKFYSDASNYIEADEIYIGRLEIRSAGRQGYALVPKVKMEIDGGVVKNALVAGLRLFGSGIQIIKNLQVTDDQAVQTQDNGISFETSSDTFDGTDVNTSTEQITVTSHPFTHDELVIYTEDASGAIGGLTDGDEVYIIYVDTNTIQLSATKGGSAIDLTSASGTNHSLQKKNQVQLLDLDLENNKTLPVSGFGNAHSIVGRNTKGWMEGSFTYDPPSIAASGQTTTTFTVTDARVGDRVLVYPPYDLQQVIHSAYVSANDTVELQLFNPTGGAIDLASGGWKVRVEKDTR